MQILTGGTGATGSSSVFNLDFKPNSNPTEKFSIGVYGNLDGASLDLKWQAPDGNYYSTDSGGADLLTTTGKHLFELDEDVNYRFDWSGAGGSADINIKIF
jgi:hypothetical protein